MVQIISERKNSTMPEKFSSAVGVGLEGATNLYNKKKENEFLKDIFGVDVSNVQDPKMRQQISEFAQKMALEKEKQQGKKGLYSELFGKASPQGQVSENKFQPLLPQQEMILALEDPSAFNAYSHMKQSHEKEQEKVQSKENLQSTLGEAIKTLVEGNLGFTAKRFSEKGRRDTQYFDTLITQLESIGKDMVSKGVLSAPRFAYLLSNLPSANKTDATNAGAIEAWAKELNLDIPGLEDLKSLYGEEEKKNKPNFDIKNPEHKAKSDQLFEEFGDVEKVRKALKREFGGL